MTSKPPSGFANILKRDFKPRPGLLSRPLYPSYSMRSSGMYKLNSGEIGLVSVEISGEQSQVLGFGVGADQEIRQDHFCGTPILFVTYEGLPCKKKSLGTWSEQGNPHLSQNTQSLFCRGKDWRKFGKGYI